MAGAVRSVPLTGADQQAAPALAQYRGIAVRETGSAAAVLRVYDGTDATGTLLDTLALTADGAVSRFYDPPIWAGNGVFVNVASGAVEGAVRIG